MDANPPISPGQPAGSLAGRGRGPGLFSSYRGARAATISTISTIVVLAALALIFLLAPGARAFEHEFLSPTNMWRAVIRHPEKGHYPVLAAVRLHLHNFLTTESAIPAT